MSAPPPPPLPSKGVITPKRSWKPVEVDNTNTPREIYKKECRQLGKLICQPCIDGCSKGICLALRQYGHCPQALLCPLQLAKENNQDEEPITLIPENRREGEPFSVSVSRDSEVVPFNGKEWVPKVLYSEFDDRLEFIRPFKHFISRYVVYKSLPSKMKKLEWIAKKINNPATRNRLLSKVSYLQVSRYTSLEQYKPKTVYRRLGYKFLNILETNFNYFNLFLSCSSTFLKYKKVPYMEDRVPFSIPHPKKHRTKPSFLNRVPPVVGDFILERLIQLRDVDDILERDISFYR